MTSPDPSARPAQVTVAGWSVTAASVLFVLTVFDALGNLRTVEVRDELARAIDSGNLAGLGLSVGDVLDAKRWALYVSAVAAVLTGVLGIYVLRRDRSARIGLSIGAVPIVLAVPLTGSFLAMMIGAGAAVLWGRQARDWFAGRPVTPREPRPVSAPVEPPPTGPDAPALWSPPYEPSPAGTQPAPTYGWGAAPGGPDGPEGPASPAGQPWPPARQHPAVLTDSVQERPRQVRNACLITWIFSGVTALLYLAVLAAITIDQAALLDRVKASPGWNDSYDDDVIIAAAVAASIIFLLWCAAVSVVAVFTWRGAGWAWIVQLVSTGLAALVAVLGLPWTLVHVAAIGATLGMLLSRPARAWFASRRP